MIVRHDIALTGAAEFSPCERYRYRLKRSFDGNVLDRPKNPICFAMLNPSTADALTNDPTVARCVNFAKKWGYSDLLVVNLFALRSTDPAALLQAEDPVGPDNDDVFRLLGKGIPVVAAWGSHKAARERIARVVELLDRPLLCLRVSQKSGAPWHPLYLPGDLTPVSWEPPT